MGPVVLVCDGCGVRIRASDPAKARGRDCPRCSTPLAPAVDRATGLAPIGPIGPKPGRRAAGAVAALIAIGSLASLAVREPSPGASRAPSPARAHARPIPPPPPPANRETPGPAAPDGPVNPGEVVGLPDLAAAPVPASTDLALRGSSPDLAPIDLSRIGPRSPRPPGEALPPPPRPGAIPADPPPPPRPDASALAPAARSEPRLILVRDHKGRAIVAREHGMLGERMAVLLPDGRIGWPDGLVPTDRPFEPATIDDLRRSLQDEEFPDFRAHQTAHYLVFYQSSREFAVSSADLLERLHDGLVGALRKQGIPVAPLEFPLVAVIFATEDDFRASRRVAPDVQAYYEILSNRIFFYEKSRRDQESPEVSALRKPQTVAHEGTHQVLHNVGIQPRLSQWPLWLVEGFAEYCSPPKATRKGVDWAGLGQVNPIHMATLRDLDDPTSAQVRGPRDVQIGRDRGTPLVEYLVTRTELTPTDYALSWALTHYLARERVDDFVAYIKEMSRLRPFEQRTPEQHLAAFRRAFGDDLAKMDVKVARYLKKLKVTDPLPYYAVVFEQPAGPGTIRRLAMVSQSPSMIRQWLESVALPAGGPSRWHALPHPTRAKALGTVEQWMMEGH